MRNATLSKTLISLAATALLVGACVSVAPGETQAPTVPAASPTPGIATPAPASPTPDPTVAPTFTAEPTPEPTPTAEPTASPEATPGTTPAPTPAMPTPGPALGRDLLFVDEFDDPTSGWDTLDEPIASVGYDSGFLAFRFNQVGWAYTIRNLESPEAVLRPVAEFVPSGSGVFGLLCGNPSGVYYGAVVDTDGGLVFIRVDSAGVSVLSRNDEAGLSVPTGDSTQMGIQCVANATGALHIELVIAGLGPIGVHSVPDAGVGSFSIVGVYAESVDSNYSVVASAIGVYGVEGESGEPSLGAQELATHIPTALQVGCSESPVPPLFSEPAQFVVTCILQNEGERAEIVEYVQFSSKADMDAAYQERVDAFGVESEGSCRNGPNETTWSINDVQLGRVQCAPQGIGIRFDWTDDRLNILSTLVDFDGDYGAVFDQWLEAGPL